MCNSAISFTEAEITLYKLDTVWKAEPLGLLPPKSECKSLNV
jgi:hypothetical protein